MAGSADILATSRLDPVVMARHDICQLCWMCNVVLFVLIDCEWNVCFVRAVVWSYFKCVFTCGVKVSQGEDLADACSSRMFLYTQAYFIIISLLEP